jgi:hypothetical protein
MTEVDYDVMRSSINDSITQTVAEEETEDTIVFGWVLIFEGIHPDDKRSLTYITSDGNGEKDLPPWQARGYMQHYLDTRYSVDFEDEENDDEED